MEKETKGKATKETAGVVETANDVIEVKEQSTSAGDIIILEGDRTPLLIVGVNKRVNPDSNGVYYMISAVNMTNNKKCDFSISDAKAQGYKWIMPDGSGKLDRITNSSQTYINVRITRVPDDGRRYGYQSKDGQVHEYRNGCTIIDRWEGEIGDGLAESMEEKLLGDVLQQQRGEQAKALFRGIMGYAPNTDSPADMQLLMQLIDKIK